MSNQICFLRVNANEPEVAEITLILISPGSFYLCCRTVSQVLEHISRKLKVAQSRQRLQDSVESSTHQCLLHDPTSNTPYKDYNVTHHCIVKAFNINGSGDFKWKYPLCNQLGSYRAINKRALIVIQSKC